MGYIGQAPANKVVKTADIEDSAVTAAKIAADTVTAADLGANSVDSSELVDGSIDTSHIADNQVTLAKMAGLTRGKIIIGNASGDPAALTVGSSGQALTSDGTDISWGSAGTTYAGIDDQSSSNDDQLTITDSAIIINEDSDDLDFRVESNSNTHALFIDGDADSRVQVGSATSVATGSITSDLQVSKAGGFPSISINSFHNNDTTASLIFTKSRNATVGSNTIVSDNDPLGKILFVADDGGDYASIGAEIKAMIDGTPGANDIPTELIFGTTADGAALPTYNMKLRADGTLELAASDKGISWDGGGGIVKYNNGTDTMTIGAGTYGQLSIFPRNTDAGSYGVATWGNSAISNNHWKFNYYDATHGKGMIRLENAVTGGSNHPNGGLLVVYSGASPDGSPAAEYIMCTDSTASRFQVNSDGDVKNHDNAYGAISDERIKQDIRDANSQWDDIKGLRVRNFKRKDDVRQYGDKAWEQIGLIAQEAELVSPKLIRETTPSESDLISDPSFGEIVDDTESPNFYTEEDKTNENIPEGKNVGDIKSYPQKIRVDQNVKAMQYSVLYMKAIKCLQEAQTRIETLEAKVTALENA